MGSWLLAKKSLPGSGAWMSFWIPSMASILLFVRLGALLETIPNSLASCRRLRGRAHRFIADVSGIEIRGNGGYGSLVEVASPRSTVENPRKSIDVVQPVPRRVVIGLVALAVSAAALFLRTPLSSPRIIRSIQLTSDGLEKGRFATDGSRISFSERIGGRSKLASVQFRVERLSRSIRRSKTFTPFLCLPASQSFYWAKATPLMTIRFGSCHWQEALLAASAIFWPGKGPGRLMEQNLRTSTAVTFT